MATTLPLQPDVATRTRRLLIVQQNEFLARSLARSVRRLFQRVEIATTPEQAAAILDDPERTPTHLVCGQHLGAEHPTGASLIPAWRARCAGLARVILLTFETDLPPALIGVDHVLNKPARIHDLTALLNGA